MFPGLTSWEALWAFCRYDLRMTEADWRKTLPCELRELVKRFVQERRWWSSRFAAIVCLLGTRKDKSPLRPSDIFAELADE